MIEAGDIDKLHRVHELAESQCTDGEISGTIAVEYGISDDEADATVARYAAEILRHKLRGRADARVKLYRLCSGDAALAKTMTRTSIAALEMFGRQHLGYTGTGVDEATRKAIEAMERSRAKGGGGKLRAV